MSPADDKTWTADQTPCQKRKIGFGEFYLDLAAHVSFRHRQDWHNHHWKSRVSTISLQYFGSFFPQTIPKPSQKATAQQLRLRLKVVPPEKFTNFLNVHKLHRARQRLLLEIASRMPFERAAEIIQMFSEVPPVFGGDSPI